ncbi:hypothetical protein TNCV_2147761 [Trichonephila clavipes]|uniref:Uncharacterized protein n=1 Tax=Trichonephila clavipes TaxID=2585209 RepID=A0A8X6SYQ6_TRICX|nr:hypothetical protein TNCV_2147761 [Trichonephila clavipes]
MSPSQYGGYDPRLVIEWVRIRRPHVQLPMQRKPCLTPPRNLATRPEDEEGDALNLHGSGNQRNFLSQNSGL